MPQVRFGGGSVKSSEDYYGNSLDMQLPTVSVEHRDRTDTSEAIEARKFIGYSFKRENITAKELQPHIDGLSKAIAVFCRDNSPEMRYTVEVKIKELRK